MSCKEACMLFGIATTVCVSQTIRPTYFFVTSQGSLCAIRNTYYCASITDNQIDIFSFFPFARKPVCCTAYLQLCVYHRQSDRHIFLIFNFSRKPVCHMAYLLLCFYHRQSDRHIFIFFLLQGSLYAVWHTYNCVCNRNNQINIFLSFFTFQGSLCAIRRVSSWPINPIKSYIFGIVL